MAAWKVTRPAAGTREPVVVTFPAPLDHGLLRRALGVARSGARGTLEVKSRHRRQRNALALHATRPWLAGDYDLVAFAFLEDLAGNRVGRAFEVDNFERTDIQYRTERRT